MPGYRENDLSDSSLAFLTGNKPPVPRSPDLARILALPRRPRVEPNTATAEALINHVTAKYTRGPRACRCSEIQIKAKIRAKPCLSRLNYVQAWALHEITLVGGMVGNLAVGSGKTIIDILAAMAMPNCKCAVLLVPSTLIRQLSIEYDLLAEHFNVPSIIYQAGSESPKSRSVPGAPLIQVLPYSRFSLADSTTFLESMRPDTIIADECQNLAAMTSTRTNRFLRYFVGHGQVTRLVAYSGTLTDDEVQDYAHFLALALREGSPLPLDSGALDDWGGALNPEDWVAPPGALLELCEPGEHVQDGYHRRLAETLGFVSTSGASIDTPLVITERKAPQIPDTQLADPRAPGLPERGVPKGFWPGVATALTHLRNNWIRPDGEELIDALSVVRCARELACGLFLRWKFIHGETEKQILEWLASRKEWRCELRQKLLQRQPYMDSPMLCANAARRAWGMSSNVLDIDDEGDEVVLPASLQNADLPTWKAETWPRWAEARDTVRPVTEDIRLDPFLAQDASNWAHENLGIVWYSTVAFGTWVAEISGLPMHGGGKGAEEKIGAEDGSHSIICSIKSHGTGRDGLQRLFSTQLVTQFPGSAVGAEQLFGRLSRIGQEAPEVRAEIFRHTPEVRSCMDAAFRKAQYVQRTMKQAQKLTTGWHIG